MFYNDELKCFHLRLKLNKNYYINGNNSITVSFYKDTEFFYIDKNTKEENIAILFSSSIFSEDSLYGRNSKILNISDLHSNVKKLIEICLSIFCNQSSNLKNDVDELILKNLCKISLENSENVYPIYIYKEDFINKSTEVNPLFFDDPDEDIFGIN